MASSSSPRNNNEHDVFLSFRGEDTRDNFTSHLYSALCQKSIATFIDNDLKRGDEISQSLLDTIEASSISIVIFSKRHASSGWCLDELLKILECKHKYGQIVIPVFYRVDPSHVRKRIGSFGDSISKLEERFPDKMQRWRSALTEVANLSGFNSHVIRPESKLIEEIVSEVLERLDDTFETENKLVGVDSRIEEILSLLGVGLTMDTCKLGIWGIGGVGKTAIAGAFFSKISRRFEGSYFAHNVREAEETGKLADLRKELLSTLLNDGNMNKFPNIGLNFQSKRLTRKKVLIVFDDVNHPRQIEFLIGNLDWFASGSRILITARDKQALINCGVNKIYQIKELVHVDALKLFNQCAFGRDHPDASYIELTHEAIKYAQGVPIALKILGRFLFRKRKEVWENAISKLEMVPQMEIQEVLKISYDGLDDKEKNIFLDIACFLVGEDRDIVTKYLNACEFFATSGIEVLVDKSLITISEYNKIRMHDLMRNMGREIVRQESINDPSKRSRLWHHKEIYEVLTENMGTEEIEGICLDMSKVEEIHLYSDTFTKMRKLRFLKFYNSSINGENKCKVSNIQDPVFPEIRYLFWHGYPLKSLPSITHPAKLVLLEVPHSNIQQLGDGGQHHCKLSQIITAARNFVTKTPNPSFIRSLNKLTILNLSGCSQLKRLPAEILSAGNMEEMILNGTAIEELPSSIECLSRLLHLGLRDCKRLKSLPKGLYHCAALESLSDLFSISYDYYIRCFELSTNYKLDRNELRSILEDALQKIQDMACTTRWKQLYENLEKISYPERRGYVYVPGNEIPKWFRFQSVGSLITLKVPSPPADNWFSNGKVIGFAFSAIVSFPDHHDVKKLGLCELVCEIKVKSEDCNPQVILRYVVVVRNLESDHLLMGYYFFDDHDFNAFRENTCVLEAVQFYYKMYDDASECLECYPVKKCGIHLFSAPDSTEDPSEIFKCEKEEEPQHPSKRLKYS
ncbi:disease resistance protein RPV1-like isoform X3 [Citrus sinensis]|uniref:disease resistance protein RPV1-like isoform X3 n=1 Tax=Citrus sinensis TaxID=2711 RepID=UPI002277F1F2|nr:disease resistance protein RPV1-like isoform X3 [Citrus sinensis]